MPLSKVSSNGLFTKLQQGCGSCGIGTKSLECGSASEWKMMH